MAKKSQTPVYVRPDFAAMTDDELWAHVDKFIDGVRPQFIESWGEEEAERRLALMRTGRFCRAREVSVCCRTPYDQRYIIQSGPHKGHGHYCCSKCGESQFQV